MQSLTKINEVLGQKLIEQEMEAMQIKVLQHEADKDRWQQALAFLLCAALVGLALGFSFGMRLAK